MPPKLSLMQLHQAELDFRSLRNSAMCLWVRQEAAFQMRDAGAPAVALRTVRTLASTAGSPVSGVAAVVEALCLMDLGRMAEADEAIGRLEALGAAFLAGLPPRLRWYAVKAMLLREATVALLARGVDCHLTCDGLLQGAASSKSMSDWRRRSPEDIDALLRLVNQPGLHGCEVTALAALCQAARGADATELGGLLTRIGMGWATDRAQVHAQAWLWIGAANLLADRPRAAVTCLREAAWMAASSARPRLQRLAILDLVSAHERLGEAREALTAFKELRSLETVMHSVSLEEPSVAQAVWSVPDPAEYENRHLRNALRILRERTAPLSVDDLAAACRVSRRTLEKAFRADLGLTVAECLRQRRLELVRAVISGSHQPIKKIAIEAGYPSASALCHDFKRAFGVSPARYRSDAQASGEHAGPSGLDLW